MLSEEELLLPRQIPCWYGCRSSQVDCAYEGGVGDSRLLIGQKDEPEVAVLPYAKGALDRRRILRQEL